MFHTILDIVEPLEDVICCNKDFPIIDAIEPQAQHHRHAISW